MHVVYDKQSQKVIALLENDGVDFSDESVLKCMFPMHNNLGIWDVSLSSAFRPHQLTVTIDPNSYELQTIHCGNKVVYTVTKDDRTVHRKKRLKCVKKSLSSIYPPTFIRSVAERSVDFMRVSAYTDESLRDSFSNFSYFTDHKVMPVLWWGPYTDAGGYATMNRNIAIRLHNHHIIPRIEICPTMHQVSQLSHYYMSHYTSIDISRFRRYIRVWGFTPYAHPPNDGTNIIYTMMETETLHPEFVRVCNAYADEVWVPTTHNEAVFRRNGVKRPIHVFPLGIDETLYYYDENPTLGVINKTSNLVGALGKPLSEGINEFRFITLFGWSYRKGTDILIKSFVKEFTDDDDVALIIVSRYAGASDRGGMHVILDDIRRYAYSIRQSKLPQIILYPDVVSEQEMVSLYRMGHAFFHTSRGEGFSLPQIEASACGLPIISCNNTGMGEYLRNDNSYMITTGETEVCSPEMHWITPYYHGQLFPKLGEPQIEQARYHLRDVRCNYDKALKKGRRLREEVFQKYTWRHATSRIAKRLRQIHYP